MSIRSKAIVETLKSLAFVTVVGVGWYILLEILGLRLGLILMLVSMMGWFAWLIYDYYVNKFTVEEKFKL
jgi:hypothetical protein